MQIKQMNLKFDEDQQKLTTHDTTIQSKEELLNQKTMQFIGVQNQLSEQNMKHGELLAKFESLTNNFAKQQ